MTWMMFIERHRWHRMLIVEPLVAMHSIRLQDTHFTGKNPMVCSFWIWTPGWG